MIRHMLYWFFSVKPLTTDVSSVYIKDYLNACEAMHQQQGNVSHETCRMAVDHATISRMGYITMGNCNTIACMYHCEIYAALLYVSMHTLIEENLGRHEAKMSSMQFMVGKEGNST